MKKLMAILIGFLLAYLLAACGPVQTPTAPPAASATSAPTDIPAPTTLPVINQIDTEGAGLPILPDGSVTIGLVSSSEPGWVCIHSDKDGQLGQIAGCEAVSAGENENFSIKLDLSKLSFRIHVALYVDKGNPGQMEIPDPDELALTATGIPITFPTTLIGELSWISVEDQALGEGNTVTISRVYTPIPALLVIHDRKGDPRVIGWTVLQAGDNLNVVVTLTEQSRTNQPGAMLHWDGGEPGYKNFNVDPPVRAPGGPDDLLVVHFHLK